MIEAFAFAWGNGQSGGLFGSHKGWGGYGAKGVSISLSAQRLLMYDTR